MQHVPVPQPLAVSRRTALLAGGGLSLVTGASACEVRSPLDPEPTRDAEPAPVDPDLALRDSALLAIATQLALVTSTMSARPRLAARLGVLKAVHDAHVAALPGAVAPTAGGVPAGTWASVLAGEGALQHQLASLAQRAESGGFARLLASMSAGVAQVRIQAGAR